MMKFYGEAQLYIKKNILLFVLQMAIIQKEHMISNAKLHGPLSDIIIEIDPKQFEDDEDTYDEIF